MSNASISSIDTFRLGLLTVGIATTIPSADLTVGCYVECAEDREAVVRLAWGLEATIGEATFRVLLANLGAR